MSVEHPRHDESFRKVFADPDVALQLLQNYLPARVLEHLDLGTLETENVSFVDDALHSSQADLLFRTRLKAGGDAFVYVLLEHKSQPDRWVILQILKYVLRIWQREVDEHDADRLPPVFPLVFYHGEQPWTAAKSLAELVDTPPGLEAYVPDFAYELLDCADIPDQTLQNIPLAGGVLAVYKHAYDADFDAHLRHWLELVRDLVEAKTAGEAVFALLKYVAALCDNVSREQFVQAIGESYPEQREDLMSSVLDQFIKEGNLHTARQDVIEALEVRFHDAPKEVQAALMGIDDREDLRVLHRKAITVASLEDFRRFLDQYAD